MSLEVVKQINVDFHNAKYIQINAKQYDRDSRFISITCCNNGNVFPIDNKSYYAYVRYRKPDELGVFNSCDVTDDGKIMIKLTEQMLAVSGKCYADLIIVNNEPVEISENTGELILKDGDCIVSTMVFCINVIESTFDSTEIESTYEFNALNDLLIKVTEDYSYIMKACKISEENAKQHADNALISENNAKSHADDAKEHADDAKTYADNAKTSETNAKESEDSAKASSESASSSAERALTSEQNAKTSETNAKESENSAKTYASNSETSANEASQFATEASNSAKSSADKALESSDYAKTSQSYAVGGTNSRDGEDADNAQYYYSQSKAINESLQITLEEFLEGVQLKTTDDGNGNVEFIYTTSNIEQERLKEIEVLKEQISESSQIINGLVQRIATLENQNVLEITE